MNAKTNKEPVDESTPFVRVERGVILVGNVRIDPTRGAEASPMAAALRATIDAHVAAAVAAAEDRCVERLRARAAAAPSYHAASYWSDAADTLAADIAEERAAAVRAFNISAPAEAEPVECSSCRGYGHFTKHGKPSIDGRDRKCLDCRGTGRDLEAEAAAVRAPKPKGGAGG